MHATSAVDDLTITADGYELLRSELDTLHTEGRREMSERLREARADAPFDDNPSLFDAFQEQAQLERRIAVLEDHLSAARIAEPTGNGHAGIGSLLRLRDLETDELVEYTLVGAIEANPGQGRVSVNAPVGRALIAATAGDLITAASPGGKLRFEVMSVTEVGNEARQAA
jgi:transcription elongation factor GreA